MASTKEEGDPGLTPQTSDAVRSPNFVLIRRNRWFLGLASLPLVGAIAALLTSTFGAFFVDRHLAVFGAIVPHFLILGIALTAICYRRNPSPHLERANLFADAKGLRVISTQNANVQKSTAAHEISAGFVVPRLGKPPILRLLRKGVFSPRIELEAASVGEARSVLVALKKDITQVSTSLRTSSPVRGRPVVAFAIAMGFMALTGVAMALATHFGGARAAQPFVAAAPLMMMTYAAGILIPAKLSIGTDGVLWQWLFRKRFIAHHEIQNILIGERGFGRDKVSTLNLILNSGETFVVPITSESGSDMAAALWEKIEEGRAAAIGGHAFPETSALLERGTRTTADWITHLRAMGSGALSTHRTAPVAREQLLAMALDGARLPRERVAAAVALGPGLDDTERERLRVAAASIAQPKLRVALERATEADDDGLAEALDDVTERAHQR